MKRRKHRTHKSAESNRTVTAILVWIGVAVLAVVLALLIGNTLGNEASKYQSDGYGDSFLYEYNADDVPPINALPLIIEGKTNTSLESAVNSFEKGSQVSIYVKSGDDIPFYASKVYEAVYEVSGEVDISALTEKLHENNIYVSVCFDCTSHLEADTFAKDAKRAIETAMIGELLNAKVDEVVILGLPTDDAGISNYAKLFCEIRQKKPDAVLGAGIKYRDLLSSNGAYALKRYSEFADFCAVDSSECKAFGESIKSVAEKLLYSFKTYPLRMLIGITGESDRTSQTDELKSLGIINIQVYKYVENVALG